MIPESHTSEPPVLVFFFQRRNVSLRPLSRNLFCTPSYKTTAQASWMTKAQGFPRRDQYLGVPPHLPLQVGVALGPAHPHSWSVTVAGGWGRALCILRAGLQGNSQAWSRRQAPWAELLTEEIPPSTQHSQPQDLLQCWPSE